MQTWKDGAWEQAYAEAAVLIAGTPHYVFFQASNIVHHFLGKHLLHIGLKNVRP